MKEHMMLVLGIIYYLTGLAVITCMVVVPTLLAWMDDLPTTKGEWVKYTLMFIFYPLVMVWFLSSCLYSIAKYFWYLPWSD